MGMDSKSKSTDTSHALRSSTQPTKVQVVGTFHVPSTWNPRQSLTANGTTERACYLCGLSLPQGVLPNLSVDFKLQLALRGLSQASQTRFRSRRRRELIEKLLVGLLKSDQRLLLKQMSFVRPQNVERQSLVLLPISKGEFPDVGVGLSDLGSNFWN
jgi:hypothetical protein